MTDYETLHDRPPTTTELFFQFLRARFLSIVLVIVGGLALTALLVTDGEIPRWIRLVGITAILISPFGYVVGSSITNLLPDPPGVVLVDVDARRMDGAVYWLPIDDFHDLEVTDGRLNQVAPSLYFGKHVDLDDLTAVGTWRGTMTDRQLLRGLQKVYECRGQLEEDAKKGFVLETQAFTIVRTAVRDATQTIVETFQRGTLPDEGEGINEAIDNALEQYDLEARIEDELEEIDDLELSEELLDPDGDLDEQADQKLGHRVDGENARQSAQQEASTDG
jgi:hypothetical protein